MKTQFIIIVLNFILDSAKSEVKYYNLRAVDNFNNALQNDSLVKPVTIVSGVSKLKCSIKCLDSKTCVSFDYISKNKACRLYEGGLNTAKDYSPMMEGTKHYMFLGGLIGQYCNASTQCVVENSECRTDGACGCKAGYSFLHSSHTCEKDCVTYGNTFQYFHERHIEGLNIEKFFGISAAQCAQLCVEATSFTCITFDIDPAVGKCFLQEVDPSDRPYKYRSGPPWNFYQRNCA